MSTSAISTLPPVAQPIKPTAVAPKPATAPVVPTPVASTDSDGDNDGTGGVSIQA